MIWGEFNEFSDQKAAIKSIWLRDLLFKKQTSYLSTTKSCLKGRTFKLIPIHVPLILSDSLDSIYSENIRYI